MGRTARPRKTYRARPVNALATVAALWGAALLSLDDRVRWQAELADALAAVREGRAERAEWAHLFDAVNVVEELVAMRLARDDAGIVQAAQAAVVQILDRQRASGLRAARAAELQALADLVAAYADLMAGISHRQRFDAESRVQARMARVLREGPRRGEVVVEA